MQTVLGLSMTSAGISWALHDATAPDACALDHDHVEVPADADDDIKVADYRAAVRSALAIADASGHAVTSVALSYPDEIEVTASLVRKWLLDLGFKVDGTLPCARRGRRRLRFGPHLRAATLVVTGVIAFFAVVPALGGQPKASSADGQPAAGTSVVSVPVAPPTAAASSLKIYVVPDVPQRTRTMPISSGPSVAEPVVTVPVAVETVEEPAEPPRMPNPVAPPQDPLGAVLSALP